MAFKGIGNQTAQPQQSRGADGGGRRIRQRPAFRRRAEIPWGNAVRRAVRDVEFGAGFRGLEEMRIAAVLVAGREAVERPGEAARPAGIPAKSLMGGLPQKLACVGFENSLLRRGSVAPYQDTARGERM